MSKTKNKADKIELLQRIATALERIAPEKHKKVDFSAANAFIWHAESNSFLSVRQVNRLPLELLKGVERMRDQLFDNTNRFARGLPANNALLWGARGMGKSSLIKAVHAAVLDQNKKQDQLLKLVEIHREEIDSLPQCLALLKNSSHRFIVFCDDLSFDAEDTSYKSLKAVLEGGIEGRPGNVLFYATSNRRHLIPRDMMENERSTAINPSEAVEEKVSLSDRFGLWIGFHHCTQDDYLEMIRSYAHYYQLNISEEDLRAKALEWSITRGGRSGRVAWQFIQHIAGELEQKLTEPKI